MTGSNEAPTERRPEVIDQRGPWPFVTHRVFRVDDIKQLWSSRHHRKGLLGRAAVERERIAAMFLRCLWIPQRLNWWIGIIFALGALLFAVASVLSLFPAVAKSWSLDATQINAIFFMGSIAWSANVFALDPLIGPCSTEGAAGTGGDCATAIRGLELTT